MYKASPEPRLDDLYSLGFLLDVTPPPFKWVNDSNISLPLVLFLCALCDKGIIIH